MQVDVEIKAWHRGPSRHMIPQQELWEFLRSNIDFRSIVSIQVEVMPTLVEDEPCPTST